VDDWEGDTVERAGKNASIATFVDKTSKVLVAKVIPNTAATLNRTAIRTFRAISDDFIKTITLLTTVRSSQATRHWHNRLSAIFISLTPITRGSGD
jgi:hypothetical protein